MERAIGCILKMRCTIYGWIYFATCYTAHVACSLRPVDNDQIKILIEDHLLYDCNRRDGRVIDQPCGFRGEKEL